ncbi:MAG TPA: biopolymer transporter ExbD [Candidatus Binatia bacterium]|nr:biopolymer transporter ExbD [Candidatus Binatia bacterium]
MALFKPHTRGHIVAEINVTPLTDVFLVLLIIFMITTSAMVKPAADVDLPKTADTEEETKGVMVTITPSKEVFVNERPVPADDASLASVLRDTLARSPEKIVILAGDRSVVLGEVVRVLGLAKEAGATGFALASE